MTEVALGRLVSRVTDSSARHAFKLGLEGIQSSTGRLIEDSKGDYSGFGPTFAPGDILFGRLRPYLAKVWVADRPGEAVGEFEVLRPRGHFDSRYAGYFLLSGAFLGPVVAAVNGAKMPRADWEVIRNVRINLPSVSIQRSLADYLDRETAQIDALIGKQERLMQTLRERRIAVIAKAVTKGVDGSVEFIGTPSDWLGLVPSHWKVKRLKNALQSTQTGVWGEEPQGDPSDVLCVRVADFDRPRLGVGNISTVRSVAPTDLVPRLLRAGDLLLEKSGGTATNPVGFVAIFNGMDCPAVSSNFITRIRLRDGQVPRYWLYSFSASYATKLTARSVKQTTGIQNLDQASLFNEVFPFPSADEQAAIADYLDEQTAKIDALIAKAEQFIGLARERRSALITAAVTGQIDVRAAS